MFNPNLYDEYEQTDVYRNIRHAIGLALSIVGAIMALYIFMNIYRMIRHPAQIELFKQILPDDPNLATLDMGDKTIRIPMGVFYFFGYLIMVFLLMVAAGIGTGFIKLGVGLMYPRVDRLEAKLYRETMKMNNKITELKTRISQGKFPPPKHRDNPPSEEDEFSFGMKHPE